MFQHHSMEKWPVNQTGNNNFFKALMQKSAHCTIQMFPAVLHLFLVAESFVGKGRYIKKIRMHWRGRFGIQVKKFCHYFLVLKEGTGKEKNIKRRLKHMNELEEIQRHPRHIVNSLAWWWNKLDWILPHYDIWSSAQVVPLIRACKVWESVMFFCLEKERRKRKRNGEPSCLFSQQKTRKCRPSHF